MVRKVLIVDPPAGWRYGFPKIYNFGEWFNQDNTNYKELKEGWFRENGYPQNLIDEGMLKYCRYWEGEEEDWLDE